MFSPFQCLKTSNTRRLIRLSPLCAISKRCSSNATQHDPLHVLFCGADEFSIYSLRALDKIRLNNPEKVASIDVVCRKDKRVGRGLKQIREVPIKKVAGTELDLQIHQIDTFTGWTPPHNNGHPFNLVVAVSFGLLIPPRILNAAKYGGLNVHPSMLPDLRGPAPLHHTLLRRLEKTGVTLQTLHPRRFDHGQIVDQTPSPGLRVPDLENATVESMLDWIGPLGAEMLYDNIMNGKFASLSKSLSGKDDTSSMPLDEVINPEDDIFGQLTGTSQSPRHAFKIKPEHRQISFDWPVNEILLRDRVLGRLFTPYLQPLTSKRVTFHNFSNTTQAFHELGGEAKATSLDAPDAPRFFEHDKARHMFFKAGDGYVSPSAITIDGKPKQNASSFHKMAQKL